MQCSCHDPDETHGNGPWTVTVTRFLALLVSPTLLILWPIVLYVWFLRSRGIGPDDLDFFNGKARYLRSKFIHL